MYTALVAFNIGSVFGGLGAWGLCGKKLTFAAKCKKWLGADSVSAHQVSLCVQKFSEQAMIEDKKAA
jgi:hypothetical protein